MLLSAHSGFRYLVLLAAVATLGYAAYGLATKRPYDKNMRILSAAFVGTLDLTILLGFANIFAGIFYSALIGHFSMMLLAAAIAHIVHAVVKRRPDEAKSYAPHLIGTAIALGCIVGGIMAIGRSVL